MKKRNTNISGEHPGKIKKERRITWLALTLHPALFELVNSL